MPSVFSDHKMIHIIISLGDTRNQRFSFNYWKLKDKFLMIFNLRVKLIIKGKYQVFLEQIGKL